MRPCEEAIARLDAIPGIGRATAEVIVAEVGTEMSCFPTAQHLASWAGRCPGNHESAGKRRSGRTRKAHPWLRAAPIEAAHAAGRKNGSYVQAQYRRLTARRGSKKAALAVGQSILVIACHLLSHPERTFQELGPDYFDRRDQQALEQRLVCRLESLGYKVTLESAVA